MRKLRENLRLTAKSLEHFRVTHVVPQQLDRHGFAGALQNASVDSAHTAAPELALDPIAWDFEHARG